MRRWLRAVSSASLYLSTVCMRLNALFLHRISFRVAIARPKLELFRHPRVDRFRTVGRSQRTNVAFSNMARGLQE